MKNNYKSIDEVLCDYIDKSQGQTTAKRGNKYWSASSLGKCLRYQFFTRKGILKANGGGPYKWKNNAMDGSAAHTWRQQALASMGTLIAAEEPIISEEHSYRGHFDGIVQLDRLVLLDIKNQNNRAFRARRREPGQYHPEHRVQIGSYFLFLKLTRFPNLSDAVLYYINRDTGERDEIILYFEKQELDLIIEELNTLNKHWAQKTVPEKTISRFCVSVCPYLDTCKAYGNVQGTLYTGNKSKPVVVHEVQTETASAGLRGSEQQDNNSGGDTGEDRSNHEQTVPGSVEGDVRDCIEVTRKDS